MGENKLAIKDPVCLLKVFSYLLSLAIAVRPYMPIASTVPNRYKLENRYQNKGLRAQATGKKLAILRSLEKKLFVGGVDDDMGSLLLIDPLYTEPDI
jgi:hypothetical protein